MKNIVYEKYKIVGAKKRLGAWNRGRECSYHTHPERYASYRLVSREEYHQRGTFWGIPEYIGYFSQTSGQIIACNCETERV